MDENLINSTQAAEILSIGGKPISRQRVSQIAKLRGWERVIGAGEGSPFLYRRIDVVLYKVNRRNGRPPRSQQVSAWIEAQPAESEPQP